MSTWQKSWFWTRARPQVHELRTWPGTSRARATWISKRTSRRPTTRRAADGIPCLRSTRGAARWVASACHPASPSSSTTAREACSPRPARGGCYARSVTSASPCSTEASPPPKPRASRWEPAKRARETWGPTPATQWSSRTVDADEVDARRTDVGWRVVDVRAAERFEGRVEPLDPIAGHIAGAINLPCTANLSDGRFLAAATLRARFDAAHLTPERTIVSCGSGVTACHTLLAMAHAGLDGAALYVGSWSEWCRSDRPREPR
ncbi:MAG: rhodanese-like domain-containing protein [Polyangiales bacterium]